MLTQSKSITKQLNKNTTIKLSKEESEKIKKFVDDGLFLNDEEFVIEAIKEKLQNMEEKTLRDIPYEQEREEIIEYFEENKICDALDIADALNLDVFEVNEIMVELIKEGIIEEL